MNFFIFISLFLTIFISCRPRGSEDQKKPVTNNTPIPTASPSPIADPEYVRTSPNSLLECYDSGFDYYHCRLLDSGILIQNPQHYLREYSVKYSFDCSDNLIGIETAPIFLSARSDSDSEDIWQYALEFKKDVVTTISGQSDLKIIAKKEILSRFAFSYTCELLINKDEIKYIEIGG